LSGTAKEPSSTGSNNTYPSILTSTPSDGSAAAGTIKFWLYGPFSTGTPTAAQCAALPLAKDSSNVSFPTAGLSVTVSGNDTYPTTNPSRVTFTPGAPGYYFWQAQYSGDLPNTTGTPLKNDGTLGVHNSDCSVASERVHVRQIPTDIRTAQSWFPNDRAVISSSISGDNIQAGGTVDFFLYNDNSCGGGTGTLKYSERHTLVAADISSGVATVSTRDYTGGAGTAPPTLTWAAYRIDTLLTDAADTAVSYSWKVVYTPASGDTAHVGRQSSCTTGSIEKFTTTYTNDNSGGTAYP